MKDFAERVGRWAAGYRADARRAAAVRTLVRDFAACVAAASQRAELAPALRLARPGETRVWGRAESFDSASAALVCGTAGSLLQLHDLYLPGLLHPSCAVIAAAVSARADSNLPPGRFVSAVAAGYETCQRIGDACRGGSPAAASIATATAGAFGAVVATALVRGGDAALVARAVSLLPMLMPVPPLAAVRAHAEAVPLHGGLAARAAIEATELAAGLDRVGRVLEGDVAVAGFLTMLCGRAVELDPEGWDGGTLDAVIGKRFPACFGAYAALEALLHLDTPPPARIVAVRIGLAARLLPILELGPASGLLYDRLMSVRWVVARALERRRLDWQDIEASEVTLRIAERITLYHEPALDLVPATMLAADIAIDSPLTQRLAWRRTLTEPGPAGCSTMLLSESAAWREKYQALSGRVAGLDAELKTLLDEE